MWTVQHWRDSGTNEQPINYRDKELSLRQRKNQPFPFSFCWGFLITTKENAKIDTGDYLRDYTTEFADWTWVAAKQTEMAKIRLPQFGWLNSRKIATITAEPHGLEVNVPYGNMVTLGEDYLGAINKV